MSHSFISYKLHNVRIHDLDLCVIRHLVIELSKNNEVGKLFQDMDWIGPGVVLGTDLECFLGDDHCKINLLIDTLNKTKILIAGFGSHVPLRLLINCKTFNFSSDYPAEGCVAAIASIISMLKSG